MPTRAAVQAAHDEHGARVNASGKSPAGGQGNFFAVDRRTFARVCTLGINPAVAYVVLARFSGRNNETTDASVHAIEKYTGISRGRARDALQLLVDHGYVQPLQSGTRPRYQLVPFAEVPGAAPPQMSHDQRQVYDRIKAGDWKVPLALCKHRNALVKMGWVQKLPGCGFEVRADAELLYTSRYCWLPNALVDGANKEPPPLELVRQTQDVMTLRLLVDLYYEQLLTEHGGIARSVIYQQWERVQVGAQGAHVVWGFHGASGFVCWGNEATDPHRREQLTPEEVARGAGPAVDFFPRLNILVRLGLVQWVPHLFESKRAEAEVLHSYGYHAEPVEHALAIACHAAAKALLREDQQLEASDKGLWLAPLKAHLADAQMFSVARLRYRPRTALTSAWWAKLNQTCDGYRLAYEALSSKVEAPFSSAITVI